MKLQSSIFLAALAASLGLISQAGYGAILPQDRQVTWQGNVGVSGGIPNRTTICATLDANGSNDTSAINAALDKCGANQVVKLNPGTFKVNGTIDWQGVANGVVLRGSGPSATKIVFSDGYIYMRAGFNEGALSNDVNLSQDAVKGAKSIQVATKPAWLTADGYYIIDQLDDPSFVAGAGTEGGSSYRQAVGNGARGLAQLVRVSSITGTGPYTVNLEVPLYYGYMTSRTAQIAGSGYASAPGYQWGIEDLRIEATYTSGDTHFIKMESCVSCWIKNVDSYNAPGGAHVWAAFSYRLEIRDSKFAYSHAYGGGQGYGVALYHVTSASLVENNIFDHLHLAMSAQYGSSGNAFGYNYELNGSSTSGQNPGIGTHGVHAYMNLFEGNYITNKVLADWTHGSSSHNTLFRNRIVGYESDESMDQTAVSIEQFNRNWNVLGNVLGAAGQHTIYDACGSGCAVSSCADVSKIVFKLGGDVNWGCGFSTSDSLAKVNVIRHGNYSYCSGAAPCNAVSWDAAIADRTLPSSLYLASKPGFFGGLPWPAFGPDLSPMVGTLPAKSRYEGIPIPDSSDTKPMPPDAVTAQ